MTAQSKHSVDWPTPQELERWASQPLEQLQAAECQAYGVVLSKQRGVRDVPSRSTQRAKRAKPGLPRQKEE